MIPKNTIAEISNKIDIIDIVGDFIKLKKNGSNYTGLCPFHNEKSPSFVVSKSKDFYKCFGCGKSGNAITFIMEHEKLNYIDTIKWFGKKYGIEILEQQAAPEIIVEKQTADSLKALNQYAQVFFSEQFWKNPSNKGYQYIKNRGFNDAVLKHFMVGYLPNETSITQDLLNNQFNKEYIIKSGLGVERNNGLMDTYKNRLIFPIHNLTGTIIGFGARIIEKTDNKNIPKYINTPETELYHKSRILYGLFFARKAIEQQDECVLLEGYTDVMAMHQAGFLNSVASGGTSLTIDQILLIKKFTNNIVIIYDGDNAGVAAAERGLTLCLNQAMSVEVLILGNNHDPDSYLNEYGAESFRELLKTQKQDFILFNLQTKLQEIGDNINKKNDLVNATAEIISQIDKASDFLKQEHYIKKCAQILEINEAKFTLLVNTFIRNKIAKQEKKIQFNEANTLLEKTIEETPTATQQFPNDVQTSIEIAEQHFVRVLLEYGAKPHFISDIVEENKIQTVAAYLLELCNNGNNIFVGEYQIFIQKYSQLLEAGKIPDANYFVYSDDELDSITAAKCLNYSKQKESEEWDLKHPFDKNNKENIVDELEIKNFKTESQKSKEGFYLRDIISVERYWRLRKAKMHQNNFIAKLKQAQQANNIKDVKLYLEALMRVDADIKEQGKEWDLLL